MRALITGAGGFVGAHLSTRLRTLGQSCALLETVRSADQLDARSASPQLVLDIADATSVDAAITRFQPTHVFHLAGISAVPQATADAAVAWQVHVHGTLNIAHAILRHAPACALIFAGSGQVYGATAQSGRVLDETALLAPTNDYAVTKAAADLALGALAQSRGLKAVRFRPFNHTGPGQSEDFVVPSFAAQIARIEAGLQPPVIRVGNLDAERDFLDVRDVAEAYVLAAQKSSTLEPGVIFNLASGVPRRVRDILDALLAQSTAKIQVELDPARLRPSDTPRFYGDAQRARAVLVWAPAIAFDATLFAILNDARKHSYTASQALVVD